MEMGKDQEREENNGSNQKNLIAINLNRISTGRHLVPLHWVLCNLICSSPSPPPRRCLTVQSLTSKVLNCEEKEHVGKSCHQILRCLQVCSALLASTTINERRTYTEGDFGLGGSINEDSSNNVKVGNVFCVCSRYCMNNVMYSAAIKLSCIGVFTLSLSCNR